MRVCVYSKLFFPVQIRDLLIDAEDENVGLSQELLEETHEDLNSLEDCVKR